MTQATTPNAGGFKGMGTAGRSGSVAAAAAVTLLAGLAVAAGVAFSQTDIDPAPQGVQNARVEESAGSAGPPADRWIIGGSGLPDYAKQSEPVVRSHVLAATPTWVPAPATSARGRRSRHPSKCAADEKVSTGPCHPWASWCRALVKT